MGLMNIMVGLMKFLLKFYVHSFCFSIFSRILEATKYIQAN